MRPAKAFLLVLGGLFVAALGLVALEIWAPAVEHSLLKTIWWCAAGLLGVAAVLDLWASRTLAGLQVERAMPGSLSLGVRNRITLTISNRLGRAVYLEVIDLFPSQVRIEGLPCSLEIPASAHSDINYNVFPVERGDAEFGPVQLRVRSRWRLWEFRVNRCAPQAARIYPNFAGIKHYQDLRHEQQISQMGVHIRQRRGEGSDFHQLREYRQGDPLRQVDWKASARHHRLISREYQDERDQEIVFMLDCGRRMRSKDDALSHFDHALNALLLMSYVALKQGDGVGILTFAGVERWLAPIKGVASINSLLNRVYDIHSGTETSDIAQAAERLMERHRKRALVILLTNIAPADRDDLIEAAHVLRRRHLLMVVSLREGFLDASIAKPVASFQAALDYCGSHELLGQRGRLLEELQRSGLHVVDSSPPLLHVNLVNKYWELKRSGSL